MFHGECGKGARIRFHAAPLHPLQSWTLQSRVIMVHVHAMTHTFDQGPRFQQHELQLACR